MKKILSLIAVATALVVAITACNKVDELPYYGTGTAVTLSASKTTVTAAQLDSTNVIVDFYWTNPKYAGDSSQFKYILEIDSTGRNFSKEITKTITGATYANLTGRELNTILINYGFNVGTAYGLDIRVTSSYGNNNERYQSNVIKLTVTPFADPSVLTSTASSVTGTLINAGAKQLTFSWTRAFTGYSGTINYTLQYDSAGKNFGSLHELALGAVMTRDMTQGEINQTALDEAVVGGTPGKIEYRIKAVTAAGATAISNVVSVNINTYIPLFRFYMPGNYQTATGNGTNWTPADAPEFIRDVRTSSSNSPLNRLYYMYVYLPQNTEFKVTPARNFNTAYGMGTNGALSLTGGNITVANAGVYRVSIDVVNMKYDIREGRMGVVGAATGAGWDPPSVFPNYALGYNSTNLFVGVHTFTVNGWKMIDNSVWNGSAATPDETRSYGSNGPSGSSLVVNGADMPNITTAGRYRVIWDGRDVNNIKYQLIDASIMKLVGDGINGVAAWTPLSSPQMTYAGNGVWTITASLLANKEFKFLAGVDWAGSFDYEDASGGATTTGIANARKVSFDIGGPNFKTPTVAGTYTITLNENTQTVTIQ